MITDAVVSLLRGIVHAVLGLLPPGDVWGGENPPALSTLQAANMFGSFIPWNAMIATAFMMLAVIAIVHGYRIVLWVLGVLHISGDNG